MKISAFYLEVVQKTILNHSDMKYNLAHMSLGMMSEITTEYLEAVEKNDLVNIKEELGDCEWFLLGWAKFEGLVIPEVVNYYTHKNCEVTSVTWQNLVGNMGKICTLVKNTIIKDKPKLDGIIYSAVDKQVLFQECLAGIQLVADMHGINMSEIREIIAKKLNVRYDGGGFDPEKSLGRDVEAERKIMENLAPGAKEI